LNEKGQTEQVDGKAIALENRSTRDIPPFELAFDPAAVAPN